MKKPYVLLISLLLIYPKLFAQENSSVGNARFGLKIAPAITWMNPDDKKKLTNDGARMKFAYGLITEFKMNNSASFCTGIEVNYTGGALNFGSQLDSVYYDPSEYVTAAAGSSDKYYLKTRTYNITYIDIPLGLKLKTGEINNFTYFGQFGVNLSIRAKAKANDVGSLINTKIDTTVHVTTTKDYEIPDLIVSKDMNLFRIGLNVGIGTEYKIAGNTSIVVSLNFHNGFTNALKSKSSNLLTTRGNNAFVQNAKINFFQLNLGVLF